MFQKERFAILGNPRKRAPCIET